MAYVFQTTNRATGKPHAKWRFQYTDYQGQRHTGTGSASKSETERLANKVEAEHGEIRRGYRPAPASADRHASDDYAAVVEEYLSWGAAQGGRKGHSWSEKHLNERRVQLEWWAEKLKFETLGDMSGILPAVEDALRSLQRKGRTGKTLNKYADSLHSFCSWCMKREYMFENPLKNLSKFNSDPSVLRRAMSVEEIGKLLAVAPLQRKLLYEVAFCTGLRANELHSLAIKDLDVEKSGLKLSAKWTKNRESGFQPLPQALVSTLVESAKLKMAEQFYRESFKKARRPYNAPENPLLYVPPTNLVHSLDVDLKNAGIPKLTDEGKIDFHACRVAYVTLVLEAGANAKEAQSLARHSTPTLTMNVYARASKGRLAEISERVGDRILPALDKDGTQQEHNESCAEAISPCVTRGNMAGTTGLEPATSTVTGWHSNQLSYVPASLRPLEYSVLYSLQARLGKKCGEA